MDICNLISTIFSIITFLTNKIDHEVKIVNSLFNFYPNKRKIALKHQIQNISLESPFGNKDRNFSLQKLRDVNLSLNKKINYSLNRNNNNNINIIHANNNDNSSQQIDITKKQNIINGRIIQSNHNTYDNYIDNKKDKKSSNDENNINKSKNAFLNFGKHSNSPYKKRNIFKQSIIIKKKETIVDELNKNRNNKKNIDFNSFYYYCFHKFNNNKIDKEIIKLFNFAITFYKQKLDIIYIFHVILLFEKIIEERKKKILSDEDSFFHLNE